MIWSVAGRSGARRRHVPDSLPIGAAVQHRYLQTKFLIVLIGFSELPAPSQRSAVSRRAATMGSFSRPGSKNFHARDLNPRAYRLIENRTRLDVFWLNRIDAFTEGRSPSFDGARNPCGDDPRASPKAAEP